MTTSGIFVTERHSGSSLSEGSNPEQRCGTFSPSTVLQG
jgi:hypothetical protein